MKPPTPLPPPAAATIAGREVRRARRSADDVLLGGVAAGLAEHLGLPVFWVRIGFVIAAMANGFGILVYLGLWMWLPAEPRPDEGAPGLAAARRQGRRLGRDRTLADYGLLVALGAISLGGLALVTGFTGSTLTVIPVVIGVAGLAVLWRQADDAQRERWSETGPSGPLGMIIGSGGWQSWLRLVAGFALLLVAVLTFTLRAGGWGQALNVAGAAVLGIVGITFIAGPWLIRLSRDLAEERAARARAQERADVAAHLHDSVLQTLALIQRSAADPAAVARLARAQERDLRTWLFEEPGTAPTSLVAALRAAAAEVEDAFGVPIEVVAVGDFPEPVTHVVAAAREAMINAVAHSGAAKVDVYCEVDAGAIEVFVRDRGCGFDLDVVPSDRAGVRNSILGRMKRHGGHASISSTPGAGTEVTLQWKSGEV